MSRIVRINGRLANTKECKKFLAEKHNYWDLVRFETKTKDGKLFPLDANADSARVIILEKLLFEKGCNSKLLEQYKDAVRAEAQREQSESNSGEFL